MSVAAQVARLHRLEEIESTLAREIRAVRDGLRMAGVAMPGRPRLRDAFTAEEAREAHARYRRGLRDDATVLGERQYQRAWRRTRRAA